MLTEMVEYCCKMEEVKAMQSEIKKRIQGTNNKGKEIGTQINDLEQKEEIIILPEQNHRNGGLSVGRERGEIGGKGRGNKKHKW